ncbi:hypothetical protein EK21DRAFT_63761 [Setomelanomma holmii]|uniref:SRR1-like domain-containing protein n=1 Tax=Setomelanomma holmii TaxID=210430 RepID=A0A9P4HA32_9PLEO|nr:hypothetical protein EK21DRAFT_63761 [Setomelanomma holmii]
MPSTCASQNLYAALRDMSLEEDTSDQTTSSSDNRVLCNADADNVEKNEEDSDQDLEIATTTFDLLSLEDKHEQESIFTRELLQRIAADVSYITSEQIKPKGQRGHGHLEYELPNGQVMTIWKRVGCADSVTIHYLTRVEMHPDFRKRFGTDHDRTILQRKMNPDIAEEDFHNHVAPYFVESWRRAQGTTHLQPSLMASWRKKLHATQKLWKASASCTRLLDTIEGGVAMLNNPITKIVCIGLGKLNARPEWYQAALQHMTVFSIAATLQAYNKAEYPGCKDLRIIAQDPCCEDKDRVLLQELTPTPTTFTHDDPATLLAIDASTLVVSAFLPTSMPLVQIVADMFADREKGPGMMLWDRIEGMRMGKRWYCLRYRDSPSVPRFLDGYVRWRNGFGELDECVMKDVRGDEDEEEGKHWRYWLNDMDLWVRMDG